jgi:CRISPR-associated protein Csb1
VFDAILRDSRLEDEPFKASQIHASLVAASLRDASALYRHAPTSLVFGAWNSTGEGGGLGAKFPRAVVSEIVGVHAVAGKRTSSRIDPLGIRAGVKVRKTDGDWVVVDEQDPATATTGVPGKKAKLLRPSEVNHGNIAPNVTDGVSVTMDYALHTFVLSFAALRRLRFGSQSAEATALGRTVLALIGLVAAMEQEVMGFALRSRCDLVPDPDAPDHQRGALEIVAPDGSTRRVELSRATTHALLIEAVRKAGAAGLPWEAEPVRLVPDPRLVQLVERSRAMALKGDADAEED